MARVKHLGGDAQSESDGARRSELRPAVRCQPGENGMIQDVAVSPDRLHELHVLQWQAGDRLAGRREDGVEHRRRHHADFWGGVGALTAKIV
jgi:hypothetical protein